MVNRFSRITLNDSILIKGWAILLIVLHNYFHLIYKVTKENEMDFDPQRFISLITLTLAHPTEWVQGVFTYFGHFGVQLFIFLSAYGMASAYAEVGSDRARFFWSRVKKIYPTFFLAVLLWLAATVAWDLLMSKTPLSAVLITVREHLYDAAKVALGVHNFFPGHGYPEVGPWWFIPFIIQFYFLWSLLGSWLTRLSENAMLVVGVTGIVFIYVVIPLVAESVGINLLYTPLGHIPEIMLGVYWARYGFTLTNTMVLGGLVVFVLSSLFTFAWPLHHISALILMLWLAFRVVSLDAGVVVRSLYILGIYSMPLFLVNGFLRRPFIAIYSRKDAWYVEIIAAVVFLFMALAVAVVLSKVEQFITRRSAAR